MATQEPQRIHRKIRVVQVIAAGILIHLTLGCLYTFGNISPYMISYLRNRTSDTDVRNVDNLWINNVGAISMAVGTTTGGILDRKLGPRMATSVGCIIYCLANAMTYFTVKRSLALVSLTYGLVATFGQACAYGPPMQAAVKWLPGRESFAAGMILGAYGGGALIFNQVITGFVNPHNLSPDYKTPNGERYFTDAQVLDNVPNLFLLLAGIYLCMEVLGIIFIVLPPNNDTEVDEVNTVRQRDKEYGPVKDVIRNMLRTKSSYVLFFVVLCLDTGMQVAISLYKAYGQTFILDDQFLATVGSVSAVFNCIGRPIWGYTMDKLGFQTTVKLIATGFVCLTSTLFLTESLGKGAFIVWICVLYGFYNGIWPIAAATMAKLFGANNMAVNTGFVMLADAIATVLGGFAGLGLKDIVGWHGLFLMSAVLGTIAFFISFLFNGKDHNSKKI